jgi:L-seryl-tRNA(Ser) seleniumtransferase/D-glucosaminate-6-phosphate ammonia-lyase
VTDRPTGFEVINAAGKMTALGGTAQAGQVGSAAARAAAVHVDMAEYRRAAGERVAAVTGAEAASITTGAAAGIAIAVAACISGTDPALVARLPDSGGLRRVVVVQSPHDVNFGAPVQQMVRLGGGVPLVVGDDGGCDDAELAAALEVIDGGLAPAAYLHVVSHHVRPVPAVSLDAAIVLARARRVPVIVDAAAEEDLRAYVGAGADLVTYSGGKAIGGPTVGFVAGQRDLVAACEAQTRGIARTMKVGKEQIAGLLAALDLYETRDTAAEAARRDEVNRIVAAGVEGVDAVVCEFRHDEAGRAITRVALRAASGAWDAGELVSFLVAGTPSIRTRNHRLADGIVQFDPREVTIDQAKLIAARLTTFFAANLRQ